MSLLSRGSSYGRSIRKFRSFGEARSPGISSRPECRRANERINGRANERTNKRTKWTNERTNERTRTNGRTNEQTSERVRNLLSCLTK
ncbi:hypothetical protein ALC57_00878 [Trachymyrmex cornetzi]|uniref:Uncharacterized protein n=1 Tax=Trachymyrmex cornetzi TaxID=471704 RepID=A0A195EN76_9HYME|nr:hypothetical protein ALC57_00878 [Trachymyrmex cornetzi]